MTGPTPNRGLQGETLGLLQNVKSMLEKAIALPGLGAETEVGQATLDYLKKLGKAIPDGAVSPGQQNAGMQQFMMAQRRDAPNAAILQALQAHAAGGGGAGAPPGAPPPPTPDGGSLPAM